jgi:hypothetical protein
LGAVHEGGEGLHWTVEPSKKKEKKILVFGRLREIRINISG